VRTDFFQFAGKGDIALYAVCADAGNADGRGGNQTGCEEVGRAVQAFDLDANHIPDAAMTLAIVALATRQTCTLRNIGSWRV
ncbi:hypothetical protein C5B26_13555, partial [Neisseria gonorrhoeae]